MVIALIFNVIRIVLTLVHTTTHSTIHILKVLHGTKFPKAHSNGFKKKKKEKIQCGISILLKGIENCQSWVVATLAIAVVLPLHDDWFDLARSWCPDTADPCRQQCLFSTWNGGCLVYPTPKCGCFRVLRLWQLWVPAPGDWESGQTRVSHGN